MEFCRPGNPPASAFGGLGGVDYPLGGVVRLNGTLYPAFAVPSADNSQLVISALTDKGIRYAGNVWCCRKSRCRQPHITCAGTFEFHLKTRESATLRRQHTRKTADHLFRSLVGTVLTNGGAMEDARTHHREETWIAGHRNVNNILFCLTSCYVLRCSSTGTECKPANTYITQV